MALAASCFSAVGLRMALRDARAAGKPLLTEAELNRMIPPPQNRQAYLAAVDFAQRDLLGYLTTNFHLTPEQIEEVQSIHPKTLPGSRPFSIRPRWEIGGSPYACFLVEHQSAVPYAVFLRTGPRIRPRAIEEEESQSLEKGDASQIQERKLKKRPRTK